MKKIPVATAELIGTFLEAIFYGKHHSANILGTGLKLGFRRIFSHRPSMSSGSPEEPE